MSQLRRTTNQQYVNQLAASLAADPTVGPAALAVLRCVGVGLPGNSYTPRVGKNLADPNRWAGTTIEDALAALVMLEAREILTPPSSPYHRGMWQPGSFSAFERVQPFTTAEWTALFERYWTLLCEYLPSYGRTVHFSKRMLTQVTALGSETSVTDASARAAFAHWVIARQLQEQPTVYGTLAFAVPQTHRVSSNRVTAEDARWMRENLRREHDTICVTPGGAFVRGPGASVRALHLSALAVRNALAYDASRAYAHGEALVAQRVSNGMGIVTLHALLDTRVNQHIIEALTSLVRRLLDEPHAVRIQAISDPMVRDAAADEVQHVAEALMDLVNRYRRHTTQGVPRARKRTQCRITPASVMRLSLTSRRPSVSVVARCPPLSHVSCRARRCASCPDVRRIHVRADHSITRQLRRSTSSRQSRMRTAHAAVCLSSDPLRVVSRLFATRPGRPCRW